MPYLHLIDEAIGLLNTEIRLIEWRIKYPEQLHQRANKQFLSPLSLVDKTTLINIMEMVSGLFLSKSIIYQNGKPAYWVDLSKGFEWLFNIKIGDCYQKHEDVIKRKPGKLTEFLNGLADFIRKEHDKKDIHQFPVYLTQLHIIYLVVTFNQFHEMFKAIIVTSYGDVGIVRSD